MCIENTTNSGRKSLILLIVIHFLAFVSYALNGRSSIIGLLLAVCLVSLALLTDDFVYSIPILIIGNDSLGTVFFGKIAFCWLAVALIICERLLKRDMKVTFRWFVDIVGLFFYTLFLYLIQGTLPNTIIKMILYLTLVLHLIDYDRRFRIDWEYLFAWVAISCFLAALHLMIFGGISYAESSGEINSMRFGIVGTGSGDPNFGGLRLVMGIICTFYYKKFKLLRLPMILVMIYAIVNTISITTMFALIIVVFCGAIFEKGISQKLKYAIGIITICFVLVYIISVAPSNILPSGMEALKYRLGEKIGFLETGNYAIATTGRSNLAYKQLLYALNRDTFGLFFGMSATPAPGFRLLSHNTYVDFIIHFGLIGFILLIIAIVNKLKGIYYNWDNGHSHISICKLQLKVLFLFFSFGLSIYEDSTFALWVLILLFM